MGSMSESGPAGRAVRPVRRVEGGVTAPPSKSVTQRALVAASMARGVSRLARPLLGDDGMHLARALTAVGIPVTIGGAGETAVAIVDGTAGVAAQAGAPLCVGNAGTAMRFLSARLALEASSFVLDGDARMRQRPIEDLLGALRALGARAESIQGNGCPPVRVGGRGLPGGRAILNGGRSSQYLSALLMAGAGAEGGVAIEVEGRLVSRPYVDLTIDMLARFGVTVVAPAAGGPSRTFTVAPGQRVRPTDVAIEGDWSSASYLFAAAAIAPGRVEVRGLEVGSRQGDARFLQVLEAMGCRTRGSGTGILVEGPDRLRPVDVDLADMPDVAPSLAVVALFADGETRITGVPHLRLKETDRIAVLCDAIGRLGGDASPAADGLTIRPRPLAGAVIDPHGDHRMAMAFAVAGLRLPGVVVLDPGCVTKSYPGFWDDLETISSVAAAR
jgi:3-phosphoshikimate 1-carboxyvinyltransferase